MLMTGSNKRELVRNTLNYNCRHTRSMMHLFFNCLAASAASGLTYVRNVVPHLSGQPEDFGLLSPSVLS